ADGRCPLRVLGAVEHHVPVPVFDDGGIEDTGRFEATAPGDQDRLPSVPPGPRAEGRNESARSGRTDGGGGHRRVEGTFHGADYTGLGLTLACPPLTLNCP